MSGQNGTPTGDAVDTIRNAIATAGYADSGVPYGPFLMSAVPQGDYAGPGFWTSQRGDFPITFQSTDQPGNPSNHHCPMGGSAIPTVPPSPVQAPLWNYRLLPAPGVPAAVVPATDMPWVLDDHGSKNPASVTYHWPTAPAGFHGLGTAFWMSNDASMYLSGACVAAANLEPGLTTPFWDDAGSGWTHNGDLVLVRLDPDTRPTGQLRFAPGSLISVEAAQNSQFDCRPWTLVADAPMLPVSGEGPPPPSVFGGWTITAVAILPTPAVSPPGAYGAFCYLGAAVSWESVLGPAFLAPGSIPLQLSIGMDAATRNRIKGDIGADCGAVHGLSIPPAANGQVSIDLGPALGMVPVSGATQDGYTITVEIEGEPVPPPPTPQLIEVWQQVIDLLLFDARGTLIGKPYRFSTPNYVRQMVSPPHAVAENSMRRTQQQQQQQ